MDGGYSVWSTPAHNRFVTMIFQSMHGLPQLAWPGEITGFFIHLFLIGLRKNSVLSGGKDLATKQSGMDGRAIFCVDFSFAIDLVQ